MKALVCGGRDYFDAERIHLVLDTLGPTTVIQGGARGADSLAANWAAKRGVENLRYPANWNRDAKRAGPIRNEWMLADSKPDYVIAFPGGKGTAHMVSIARRDGVPVVDLRECTAPLMQFATAMAEAKLPA